MTDARLDLSLPIGVADAPRQGDDAVVREHLTVERVECGLVDARLEDSLFEIVEDGDTRRPAETSKGALVELHPNLSARRHREQTHALRG